MAVMEAGDFRRLIKTRLLVGVLDFACSIGIPRVSKATADISACGAQVEMLGSIGAAGAADWSVLIMDPVSTRVMSHACQISEILDYGISCELLADIPCM